MPSIVNSVLGPVAVDDLGVTLVHEHLVYGHPGWQYDSAAPAYDRASTAELCTQVVTRVRSFGVRSIIDCTPNDGGRDTELYRQVAARTGVNIICATGFYNQALGASSYYRHRAALSGGRVRVIGEIYETLVKDITEGIGDSGIKAGIIKVGTSRGTVTHYEEMVLEAAALAQRDTGVPIITHTEDGTMGPEQAEFLISRGADPRRLVIGHMCGNTDLDYHLRVLRQGGLVAFDRFGLELLVSDDTRVRTLSGLVERGYAQQIVLSQDYVVRWLGREFIPRELGWPSIANWQMTNLFTKILPTLRERGITEEQISIMMVQNPRQLFLSA